MQQYAISDLIRRYFAAFLAQDRKTLEEGLSDDFSFTSPYDDHISKATFFERCLPGSVNFRSHQIEKLFVNGNEAFMRYWAELKDGTTFRNTEYIRLEGNKIREVEVYLGPFNETMTNYPRCYTFAQNKKNLKDVWLR